jgi:hypothetical protein
VPRFTSPRSPDAGVGIPDRRAGVPPCGTSGAGKRRTMLAMSAGTMSWLHRGRGRLMTHLMTWLVLGSVCVQLGVGSAAAAATQHHRPSTHAVNPRVCPAPSVVAYAYGIAVLQVSTDVKTGPSNTNTCNYLTTAVLVGGQPTWQSVAYFSWPTSKASFGAERAYASTHDGGIPLVGVPHVGTEAYAPKTGVPALTVLSGNVQLELGPGQGRMKINELQMVALAKKIL